MRYSLILCILIFVALASANYSKRATRKISTCEQLRELRREKVIKQRISLVADIDCKNIPFTPLKILFTKFDGKGHTIKNLNLRYSGKKKNIHQIGLFNSLASGSVVRNVTFVNVSVRGIRNVGIVAGNSHMAIIEHVRVDSNTPRGNTVIGRSNKVGGIIGYAKDSTLTSISVKNTLVKGINKVGGIVGLFTGGQMFNAANLGFKNSSTSIVEGIRSVGGIVGESSASSFTKVGVRRGIIFGQVSVGGISGKSFDTEKADQLYILKYIRLIYRSGAGSEFGGLFGSYIIEGDRNYTISNSYTKARIVAQEHAGGIVGHLNMDTPDAVVFFRNLIVASPIKRAPNSGKLIGSLEFNPNTQTFEMTHVYYFNGINDYLGEIGVVSDSQNHQDPDPNDGTYKKSTVLPTGVGLEYVSIVENAIKYFNQEHIWCQDRLRGEQGFDAKHQICRCGPYSQDYYGACLCSSFTELSENGSFCINSTGVCTTPWHFGKKFVSGYDNIYLEITANDVHFVETGPKKGNLEVKLRYTAQATAWTDIVVLGKKGAFVASLSNYLLGKGFEGEEWKQSLDKTGNECVQQSSFSLPWSKVAQLTQVSPFSGDFLLRVYAHTNLLRKEKTIILRDEPHGENAELITAVPILISLNTSVTTSASLSANFTLDFNVDATYYVKSTEIDPSGLFMNVVLSHTVTNPLSLDVEIDSIKVEGNPTSGKIVSSIPTNCGPNFNIDNQTIVCQQETTISIDLPVGNDCTDKIVNLQIFFKASCEGPNKNQNSTLCQSVYNQVSANNATTLPASISFDFNFCPHIEDTTLNTKSFKIRQLGHPVKDGHSVKSNHALNSTITLEVIETVVDSSFASAHIEYVYLYEKVPSNDTVSFLDVTIDCSLENGFEVRKDEIQISFSYIPNIYMLSKLLKNWHTGLYFVVVIDVQYEPNGSHQKRNSPFNTQVRLQLPISNTNGHSTERTSSKSSIFVIKEETGGVKRSDSKTDLKDFTLEKAKSISEQYTRESKRNELLMIVLGGSFGITMFIILITLIVVVYNHYKKPKTTVIQLQTEQN